MEWNEEKGEIVRQTWGGRPFNDRVVVAVTEPRSKTFLC